MRSVYIITTRLVKTGMYQPREHVIHVRMWWLYIFHLSFGHINFHPSLAHGCFPRFETGVLFQTKTLDSTPRWQSLSIFAVDVQGLTALKTRTVFDLIN